MSAIILMCLTISFILRAVISKNLISNFVATRIWCRWCQPHLLLLFDRSLGVIQMANYSRSYCVLLLPGSSRLARDHFSILPPHPPTLAFRNTNIREVLVKVFKKWWAFYTLFPSCRPDVEDYKFLQGEGAWCPNHCMETRYPDQERLPEAITIISLSNKLSGWVRSTIFQATEKGSGLKLPCIPKLTYMCSLVQI